MEQCHYCQMMYHPMPVWTKPGSRIHVCHIRIVDRDGNMITGDLPDEIYVISNLECAKKAEADGYKIRLDLTPKR